MKQLLSNPTSSTETSTSLSGIFSPLNPALAVDEKGGTLLSISQVKVGHLARLGEGRIFHAGNSEIAEEGDFGSSSDLGNGV
jgi:hypothetical protein